MMYHIQPFKGIINGLKAFNLLRKIKKKVELHMFGVFPRPYIDFPFYYYFDPSEEEIAKIYSSSDLFIFTSVIDGFPKPPLEAMACRKPVILTDCLGIRDYAKDGKNCLIIPPSEPEKLSEAMIELIENDELRERLAGEGYRTAQEFNYERVVDQMEKIFQKALECVDDSLTEWERVVRIAPLDPWAHYNLGLELYSKGEIDKAGYEFEKAIELNPHFALAYKELEKLLFQSIKRVVLILRP
jgi:tetratricopeptide (TPR) repeat protein